MIVLIILGIIIMMSWIMLLFELRIYTIYIYIYYDMNSTSVIPFAPKVSKRMVI